LDHRELHDANVPVDLFDSHAHRLPGRFKSDAGRALRSGTLTACMDDNPWLSIGADDYEGHMRAVGQSAVLRDFFRRVCAERRPTRLAILGCAVGADFEHIDPDDTQLAVGVDINPDYLAIARARFATLGPRMSLIAGDVLRVDLPGAPFDLIHAAMLLEYVDPTALFRRMQQWLAVDGVCSVVTQDPMPGVAPVSTTEYESLRRLTGLIVLRSADEIAGLADQVGLRLIVQRTAATPAGKRLVHSVFATSSAPDRAR
jgi:ubiquinone/menaquinone biosynthesis C-methylase UbiE